MNLKEFEELPDEEQLLLERIAMMTEDGEMTEEEARKIILEGGR